MNEEPDLTAPLAFIIFVLLGGGFLMWTSAHAASFLGDGQPLDETLTATKAVIATIQDPGSPALGWGDPSIGHPAIYWTIFIVQLLALLFVALTVWNVFQSDGFGLRKRTRLDADTEAHLAKAKDLTPLLVKQPVPDRFSLGRFGRHNLAAENRTSKYDPGPQSGKARRQTGDRGPVMFVGPTRSGKSVGVISAMLDWHGPIIASSVKDDLLRPTIAHRRLMGETAVFDPTESLRRSYLAAAKKFALTNDPDDAPPAAWDPRLCVSWSPLALVKDYDDAQRVATALAEAAPGPSSNNSSNGDFWLNSARQILEVLLYAAALTGQSFDKVVDWAIEPPDPETVSPYAGLFTQIRGSLPPHERAAVTRIEERLNKTLSRSDTKTSLNDVYATMRTIVQPWFSDRLSASASGKSVDLEWLLEGGTTNPRTFYLSAPPDEAKRLQAVFGGCINDLIGQVYRYAEAHGPIEPPLLIVLDEAANMPLPMLPQYASTLAGLGVQLVTVFQDFGQIFGTYGAHKGGSIISNHTSRLFFRGIAEQDTTKWIENATGSEEVENVTTSSGIRSESETHGTHRLALLPSNVIREQPLFEALLIHGGLPPAHIQTNRWFEDKQRKAKATWPEDAHPDQGIPELTAFNSKPTSWQGTNGVIFDTTDHQDTASHEPAATEAPQDEAPVPASLLTIIGPKVAAPDEVEPTIATPTDSPTPNTVEDFFRSR